MRAKSRTFTFKLLTSTFDLITDWLLLYDVSGIKQGLVFGPFSDIMLGLLLLFCCVGTVTYIAELILNLLDICAAEEELFPSGLLDNINLVSLWIEDVPLVLMSVYIAGCRDTAVTVILLVKGVSTFLEVLVNTCGIINKHIQNKTQTEVIAFQGKKATSWINIPVSIALFILLVGSLVLFSLCNFVTSSRNVIQLPSPFHFSYNHYDSEKYLGRAGLYLNSEKTFGIKNDDWIKLADITNITSSQSGTFLVSISYDSNPNTRLWIQTTSSNDLSSPESSTCYSTQSSPFSVLTSCPTDMQTATSMTTSVFKFVYESPSSRKPLGDIFYNYNTTSFLNEQRCRLMTTIPVLSLRYFKANSNIDDDMPLLRLNETKGKYYQTGSTMRAASEVWMTGMLQCCSTGKSAPGYDSFISVPGLKMFFNQTTTPCTTTNSPTIPTSTTLGSTAIFHQGFNGTSNTTASTTQATTTTTTPDSSVSTTTPTSTNTSNPTTTTPDMTTNRNQVITTSTSTNTPTTQTTATTKIPDSTTASNVDTTTTTTSQTSTITTSTTPPTTTTTTTGGTITTTTTKIITTTSTSTTSDANIQTDSSDIPFTPTNGFPFFPTNGFPGGSTPVS